jgi:hypothetical protein
MINRRDLISGIAGGTISAGAVGFLNAGKADTGNIQVANNVMALKKMAVPADRTCAVVLGYGFSGDGGDKLMYWDANSEKKDNQGSVIASLNALKGRWLQIHNGVMDFRDFGIFNGQNAADDALEAMMNDPLIHRIEARTPLNFTRRHSFSRSNITLDFGGQSITTLGLEALANPKDNYLSAIFGFRGAVDAVTRYSTLQNPLALLTDIYPVENSADFPIGSWFCLESDIIEGYWERKIQRLVQVTEHINEQYIRLNYKSGWPLEAGGKLAWRRVEPIENVIITNMVFVGEGKLPNLSSQPIAFEYAIYCDAIKIRAKGTFWSVIFRRWNTYFRTEQCSLSNPPTVEWGGAGYLTQQLYCQYGHISDCNTSNARHLNDFTASSSCLVENCHGDGDSTGAFVTHGQYEHDLKFIGNSGIITLANSGKPWGQSAARITISQHVCTTLLADAKVSELTLTDVHICRDSTLGNLGVLRLNCDGVSVESCTVEGELTLVQASKRSTKMNVFQGCGFIVDPRHDSTISNLAPDDPYIKSHGPPTWRNSINGDSRVHFSHCRFTGSEPAASLMINNTETSFDGCELNNTALKMSGNSPQTLIVMGNSLLTGTDFSQPLLSRTGTHPVTWLLGPYRSEVAGANRPHLAITEGVNHYQAQHVTFSGGQRIFSEQAFSTPSYFVEESNITINVRSTLPALKGQNIVIRNITP